MKNLLIGMLFVMLTAGTVFAAGGQNQGTEGSGTTSTGDIAQGDATQVRDGR